MGAKKGTPNPNSGKGFGYAFLLGLVGHTGDACVIWPLSGNHKGYGMVGVRGKRLKAHRVMCELAHGAPPTPKHQAAHSCGAGHTDCVNPKHLEWKTNRDNQMDRVRDGTMPKKGKPKRILTPEQIAEVRALKGKVPQLDLARRFGVKPGAIEYWQSHDKPPATLTDETVRAIRAIGRSQPASATAAQFGISEAAVYRILNGQTWRQVA